MSIQKYSIDTNIFIRMLSKDNATMLEECADFFDYLQVNYLRNFYVDINILNEVVFVFNSVYGIKPIFCIDIIDRLLQLAGIRYKVVDSEEVYQTAKQLCISTGVKYSDCVIAANLASTEIIVTYNTKDFAKLGVKAITPKQFLQDRIN